jgi:hypothetical protein
MTPEQWIALLQVLVWPLVVAAAVVLLRHPLGRFLEGIGERATKLSILKVELELGQARGMSAESFPSLDSFKEPEATAWASDSAGDLFLQIQEGSPADYAIVDLGTGEEWLTSRLYIFAVMLRKMRGLRALVFVYSDDSDPAVYRRFVGTITPEALSHILAFRYPWLEQAYLKAYEKAFWQKDLKTAAPSDSPLASSAGALLPRLASGLVRDFVKSLQHEKKTPPEGSEGWVSLRRNRDLWERAEWLTVAKLRDLLGEHLVDTSVLVDSGARPEETVRHALRLRGELVAVVDGSGRFVKLIDRRALADAVARQAAIGA